MRPGVAPPVDARAESGSELVTPSRATLTFQGCASLPTHTGGEVRPRWRLGDETPQSQWCAARRHTTMPLTCENTAPRGVAGACGNCAQPHGTPPAVAVRLPESVVRRVYARNCPPSCPVRCNRFRCPEQYGRHCSAGFGQPQGALQSTGETGRDCTTTSRSAGVSRTIARTATSTCRARSIVPPLKRSGGRSARPHDFVT